MSFLPSTLTSIALATSVLASQAQTVPPIKGGHWEMRADREVDGVAQPKHADVIKRLAPDLRSRTEWQLRHGGATPETDSTTVAHLCISQEEVQSGGVAWAGIDARCSVAFTERSSKQWKWHSDCAESQIDGEVTFITPEKYRFQTLVKLSINGAPHSMKTDGMVTWVGQVCLAR